MTLVECVNLVYGFYANRVRRQNVYDLMWKQKKHSWGFSFHICLHVLHSIECFECQMLLFSHRRLLNRDDQRWSRSRQRLENVFSSHSNILLSPAWAAFVCLGYPQGNSRKYSVVGQCSAKVSEIFLEFAIVTRQASGDEEILSHKQVHPHKNARIFV